MNPPGAPKSSMESMTYPTQNWNEHTTPANSQDQEAEVIGVRLSHLHIEEQTESDLSELKSVKTNDSIKTLVVIAYSLVKRVSEGLAYSSESRSDIVIELLNIVSRGIPRVPSRDTILRVAMWT